MKKILQEPLLHFLLLGGALFALFQSVGGEVSSGIDQGDEIVVTAGRIDSLSQNFEKAWQRPPSPEEMEGLIRGHVREEILYREALRMGLDRDDVIVRRRLRQKIEFLSEDLASLDTPTEEELQEFLAAHPARFRQEARFSFRQVYLNSDKRSESAEGGARALLARLREQDGDAASLGDSLMIEHRFENETASEVSRALGSQFPQALLDTPIGSWQGPVRSSYGLHLVHIEKRIDGKNPDLAEVREVVQREWAAVKRKQSNEAFYEMLRERYTITVASPKDVTVAEVAK